VAPQIRSVEFTNPQTTDGQTKHNRRLQAYLSLGIGSSNSRAQSLENEVDNYLTASTQEEWDSIAFWEVLYSILYCQFDNCKLI